MQGSYVAESGLLRRMERRREKRVESRAAVIETPLTFFEVEEEAIFANAAQFKEAEFGVAPKGFDAVDVVFAACELVLVMMDAVVFVALEDEAVVSLPSVGVDVGAFEDAPDDNRHQFLLGAVLYHAQIDVLSALVQADDGDFTTRPAPAFAPHPAWPKVALIDLHFTAQGRALAHRQGHDPLSQQLAKPMHGAVVQSAKFRRRQHRHIMRKILQNPLRHGW